MRRDIVLPKMDNFEQHFLIQILTSSTLPFLADHRKRTDESRWLCRSEWKSFKVVWIRTGNKLISIGHSKTAFCLLYCMIDFTIWLALQQVASDHGLILVDTKYEFGKANDGSILLIDEVKCNLWYTLDSHMHSHINLSVYKCDNGSMFLTTGPYSWFK